MLKVEVSDEKIYEAMNEINPLKAPDGVYAIFYPKTWNITCKSVCDMVRSSLLAVIC